MEIDALAPIVEPAEREAAALARLYDLDLREDPGDLDLYLALAERTGGPVLELAVGTGRLAVPLAAAGYEVTGVDLDGEMLRRAEARARATGARAARRLWLERADIVGLDLFSARPDTASAATAGRAPARRAQTHQSGFRLAILALNSLLLLGDRARQAAALLAMARHVGPGGLAVVDVWLPDAEDLARYDGRLILEYLRRDPETGHWVTKSGSAQHDAATGTVLLTTIYEEGEQGRAPVRWVRRDRLRLVGADDLRAMALEAGLSIEVIAGSYDLDPLRPGDERAVLVATKPSGDSGLV